MPRLEPCPSCQRHIRTDEAHCPFCAAAVPSSLQSLPERPLPRTRLGRAALFAFGVSAAAGSAAIPGCGDDDDEEPQGEVDPDAGQDDGSAGDGSADGNADGDWGAPLYGAPAPEDAGTGADGDDGTVQPLYGLAPPPDAGSDAGALDADGEGSVQPLYGISPLPDGDGNSVPIYGSPALPAVTEKD